MQGGERQINLSERCWDIISCNYGAMVWMFVSSLPPKFICWYPNAQYDGTKKWSLWEVLRSWGWTLTNGISALLLKEPTHSCLISSATRGHNEKSETQKRTLTQPHRHPDFRLQASRTVRINFCCLQAIQSVVFCYSSLNRLKHMAKKKKNLHMTLHRWDKVLQEKIVGTHVIPLKSAPTYVGCLSGTLCLSSNFH